MHIISKREVEEQIESVESGPLVMVRFAVGLLVTSGRPKERLSTCIKKVESINRGESQ